MATQIAVEQPIILYSTETIGPIGPPGPTAVSNTPGNLATLGNDFLLLVPGPVSGNASPTQVVKGNDSRLTDARVPLAHAVTHKSGGTDAIALDTLAAPTDVTTLNASTSAHGLLRKLDGNVNHVLQGDGSWGTPAGGGNMSKSDYDTNNDLIVDHASLADSVSWNNVSGKPVRFVPAGVVVPFAGSTAPTGYLLCDGTSYPTATYPDLFAAIQYTYGGSGANFNVPDLRGRTPVGAGAGTGLTARTLGGTAGEERHTLITAELAAHNHTANQADHYHTLQNNGSHAHSATMPDHQHGLPPFSHSHGDPGHAHIVINAVGTSIGVQGGSQQIVYPSGGVASQASATGLQAYTTPTMPTYYSSQYGGQPGFATAAAGVPATTYESQTMGAVGVVNIANTGSGTPHNVMQPSLFLNYIVAV